MTDPKPPSQCGEPQNEKWYERTRYQILLFAGGIIVYLLFGLLLWWVLDWYINPQDSGEKKDLVQALGLIMAGVAGAIGICFTWRGQRITQKGLQDTRKTTEENLRLTEQGQITERFMRAIEQLGATDENERPKLETRLGAIYALEHIARDSKRHHWSVMEILTSYVRQNAPWPPKDPEEDGFLAPPQVSQTAQETPNSTPHVCEPEISRSTDIEAILMVLWRRERHLGNGEDYALNLVRVDLRGRAVGNTHLEAALLAETHFGSAFLQGVYMQQALLRNAHLEKANLENAHLEGATLVRAHLQGANLKGANLKGANLKGANLNGANLIGANVAQEQLDKTRVGNENTRLPPNVKPPAHWGRED